MSSVWGGTTFCLSHIILREDRSGLEVGLFKCSFLYSFMMISGFSSLELAEFKVVEFHSELKGF